MVPVKKDDDMNTYLIVDISGKVLNYDYALCEAMADQSGENQIILSAHLLEEDSFHGNRLKLIRLVPLSYKSSVGKLKRMIKAIEGFVNYIVLLCYAMIKRPNVIHFQWFPFLEFSSIEIPLVKVLRWLSPQTKILYTIHNVYPHSMNHEAKRLEYKKRFMKMKLLIDHFVVHTESSANEVIGTFGIEQSKLSVIYHGIFTPKCKKLKKKQNNQGKKTIIFYGANRPNKGADILLEAMQKLPNDYKNEVRALIVGRTADGYLSELRKKAMGIDVTFDPRYVPDSELYQMIEDAEYIALPYREITQSGVLLLALYFEKPLLISNLSPFRETLKGFSEDMFFEASNAESMCNLIIRHLSGKIDIEREKEIIRSLRTEYSWENSAKKTLSIYCM